MHVLTVLINKRKVEKSPGTLHLVERCPVLMTPGIEGKADSALEAMRRGEIDY